LSTFRNLGAKPATHPQRYRVADFTNGIIERETAVLPRYAPAHLRISSVGLST
jgi:hypothetical protein